MLNYTFPKDWPTDREVRARTNQAGSHSKSIRNRSGCPVVGKQSRSPAAVGNNTAPWQVRVCQGRLRQRSQRLRVFSLYALCRRPFLVPGDIDCLSLMAFGNAHSPLPAALVDRGIGRVFRRARRARSRESQNNNDDALVGFSANDATRRHRDRGGQCRDDSHTY